SPHGTTWWAWMMSGGSAIRRRSSTTAMPRRVSCWAKAPIAGVYTIGRWPRRSAPTARSRNTTSDPAWRSSQMLVNRMVRLPLTCARPDVSSDRRSDDLVARHLAHDFGRVAEHDHAVGHVARHHRAGADHRVLADGDARTQDAAAADARGAQDARRLADERHAGPAVGHVLVVQRHGAGSAEYMVLDDDAAREIAAALQRDEIPHPHVALDVDVGADQAVAPDDRVVANEHEVADARAVADLHVIRDDAVLLPARRHPVVPNAFRRGRERLRPAAGVPKPPSAPGDVSEHFGLGLHPLG